jgi:hypothetical protein
MGKFVAANRAAATLLLVMVLVSGCTSARVTRFSGGVTHSELEHGKLALAAITSVGEGETPQAEALARKIESRFRKARPWLTLLPLSNVRTNFDAAEYQQQLQLMSEWEDWSSFWLADFNRLTNHVRFLLLAHLRTQVEVAEAHRGPDPVTILFDLLWATFVDRDSDDADDDWEEEEEEEEETETCFTESGRWRRGWESSICTPAAWPGSQSANPWPTENQFPPELIRSRLGASSLHRLTTLKHLTRPLRQ